MGRRTRNRKAREEALLSAAGKLFASRGYEATTTREIAAYAGCAEGLISRYFKGKAGLLRALIGAHISKRQMLSNTTRPVARDFEDEIVQLVSTEVQQIWEDREFFRAIIPHALQEGESVPNLSQITLAMGSEAIARQLRQSPSCRVLSDQKLASLARLINVTGFVFGFWYPVALGQDIDSAKDSAVSMAGVLAQKFQPFRTRLAKSRTNPSRRVGNSSRPV